MGVETNVPLLTIREIGLTADFGAGGGAGAPREPCIIGYVPALPGNRAPTVTGHGTRYHAGSGCGTGQVPAG